MKQFFKKAWDVIQIAGLMLLGLLTMVFYFFKWLGQRIIIWIRDTRWVRKTGRVLVKVTEAIYAPVYCVIYLASVILRTATCVCYFLMFDPGRAWRAFKLVLK